MTGSYLAFQARATSRCIPLTVHLELTYRCNARCTHCFQDRDAAPRELAAREWMAVVDQARALGALTLNLSGGEAMLSPHFWTVAEHARRQGMALRVLTNGILLTRQNVVRLAALRPYAVHVSLFSLRADRHDAVTGVPGSLSRAVRGLLRLRRAGIPVTIACPLLGTSGGDHAAVGRLAERTGASALFDPRIVPGFGGASGPTRCRGDDQLLSSYFAAQARQEGDGRRLAPPVSPDRAPCGLAQSFAVVSPKGELLPCSIMHVSAGSVRRTPLDVLWRESAVLQRLRARRFGALRECGTCARSGYCGRCSAVALLEDGDMDGPSSFACHIAELREKAWGVPPPAGAPRPKRPRLRVLQG